VLKCVFLTASGEVGNDSNKDYLKLVKWQFSNYRWQSQNGHNHKWVKSNFTYRL